MAVTVTAALVDDTGGTGAGPNAAWANTPPAGHAGWNNTAGDDVWVPDRFDYRRVLLECTGDPGEVGSIVNWEIYSNELNFVADASTESTVDAPFVNNIATRTIWTRNGTTWGGGAPYYEESGTPWVSSLRANGNRVVVEVPVYAAYSASPDTVDVYVEAYLPGSFGTPSASAILDVTGPTTAVFA